MAYRDDRNALPLQVAQLERENQWLREENAQLRGEARRERDEARELQRRSAGDRGCIMCGGSFLPVAVFSGHNHRSPVPLSLSTLRFVDPDGGFTRSTPVRAKVCASCGYVHCFIDIGSEAASDALAVGQGDGHDYRAQASTLGPDDST